MRIALLATLVICAPAAAHDFFLTPSAHRIAVGDPVTIVMRVGSEKEMDELPRSNRRIVRFEAHLGGKVQTVEGKHGESPAGRVAFEEAGVATIVYQSSHTDIELDGPKFEHYLVEEGLDDIASERAKLGVSASPGRESYARYAKSLVTVGGGDKGWDHRVGLAAELVALTDPRAGGTAQFQLLYEDKPRANARVDILRVEKTQLVSVGHARTDANGKVALAIPGDGVWLVGTTLMRAAPQELGLEGDWESFWVSLEFETGAKPKKKRGCATSDPASLGLALALLAVLGAARRRVRDRDAARDRAAPARLRAP
jgi:MYXO-CTERM domain-containing protein